MAGAGGRSWGWSCKRHTLAVRFLAMSGCSVHGLALQEPFAFAAPDGHHHTVPLDFMSVRDFSARGKLGLLRLDLSCDDKGICIRQTMGTGSRTSLDTSLWSRTLWISLEVAHLVTVPTSSCSLGWPVPSGGIGSSVLTELLVCGRDTCEVGLETWFDGNQGRSIMPDLNKRQIIVFKGGQDFLGFGQSADVGSCRSIANPPCKTLSSPCCKSWSQRQTSVLSAPVRSSWALG